MLALIYQHHGSVMGKSRVKCHSHHFLPSAPSHPAPSFHDLGIPHPSLGASRSNRNGSPQAIGRGRDRGGTRGHGPPWGRGKKWAVLKGPQKWRVWTEKMVVFDGWRWSKSGFNIGFNGICQMIWHDVTSNQPVIWPRAGTKTVLQSHKAWDSTCTCWAARAVVFRSCRFKSWAIAKIGISNTQWRSNMDQGSNLAKLMISDEFG